MTLGEKIRRLRTMKGYTQEVMADSLKLSVAGYGKIERDETDITVSRISQIAEILSVRVEDILRLDDNIAFHNYSGSQAHNFGHLQNYYNSEEAFSTLKALYESRISRLEEDSSKMRKILAEILKKV